MSESVTPRFYVIHGDNDIAIDKVVNQLRSSMGEDANAELNISEFDGTATPVAEVLGAVKSFPFLSDKRLVIVTGLLKWITRKGAGTTGKKAVERLLQELLNLPEYARLLMVERDELPQNHPILQLAGNSETGYLRGFTVPKDTTHWIIQRVREEYDSEIDPQAALALASVTGSDLRRADNEIVKLVSYVDGGRITEAEVALLTPYVAEANVFAMVDAMATGMGDQALRLLHRTLGENPRDNGFGLFGLIIRHFRLLLLTREHLENGGGSQPAAIARAIGLRNNWQASKLSTQSRAFTLEQLEQIYRRLQSYDVDMKVGKVAPRLALDLLVASLATK